MRRSARATCAPRSCPSRPGRATRGRASSEREPARRARRRHRRRWRHRIGPRARRARNRPRRRARRSGRCGRAVDADVLDVHRAVDHRQHAERERGRRLQGGSQPRGRPRSRRPRPAAAISAASACWESPRPGWRCRNASSSAWRSAIAGRDGEDPSCVVTRGQCRDAVVAGAGALEDGGVHTQRPCQRWLRADRGPPRVRGFANAPYCASAQPSLRGSLPAARTPSSCRRTTCAPPVTCA